jgi:hypothetical protein
MSSQISQYTILPECKTALIEDAPLPLPLPPLMKHIWQEKIYVSKSKTIPPQKWSIC